MARWLARLLRRRAAGAGVAGWWCAAWMRCALALDPRSLCVVLYQNLHACLLPSLLSPCSNGVVPDNQFYGMLMRAAGAHGDLDAVIGLQAEMRREGLQHCAVRRWCRLVACWPAGPGVQGVAFRL